MCSLFRLEIYSNRRGTIILKVNDAQGIVELVSEQFRVEEEEGAVVGRESRHQPREAIDIFTSVDHLGDVVADSLEFLGGWHEGEKRDVGRALR
jgi:hypothetical protein